jgi:hypothetical protein
VTLLFASSGDLSLELPVGLAVIYLVAAIIWYELIRSVVMGQWHRRRDRKARLAAFQLARQEEAESAERRREISERQAAEESEPDPARRHYYLARKAAQGERDSAVEAAQTAAREAIERIERRFEEIEHSLDDEEAERIRAKAAAANSRTGLETADRLP